MTTEQMKEDVKKLREIRAHYFYTMKSADAQALNEIADRIILNGSLAGDKPVAWMYEQGTEVTGERTYTDKSASQHRIKPYQQWGRTRLSFSKPNAPGKLIRNLTPLYDHPSPAPAQAAEPSTPPPPAREQNEGK